MSAATQALLLDVRGAAAALSVSPRTVQTLVYSGELPSVKIGRSRRIADADLAAYVARLRNENDRESRLLAAAGGGRSGGTTSRKA